MFGFASGTLLRCGQHKCPSKCHQISDHSKMPCLFIMRSRCPNNHPQSWECHRGIPLTCRKCEQAAKAAEEKSRKDFELQQQRDADQLAHKQTMDALNEKIAKEEQIIKDIKLAEERENALRLKEKDLADAKARASKAQNPTNDPPTPPPQQSIFDHLSSVLGNVLGSDEKPLPDVVSSDIMTSRTIRRSEHTHINA
jgi:hypothetical protein